MTPVEGCVIAVYGPTGSGKTALAAEVASRLGVRVITADSKQIYRGFPVLTNQPDESDRRRSAHALVDFADPGEDWTAVRYAELAHRLIDADVRSRGYAVVAGGTGLYLRAALAPLEAAPAADPELRAELNQRVEEEGVAALHAELEGLDPDAAARVDPRNPRRVVRALEVTRTAGPGAWARRGDLWDPAYRHPTLLVGLEPDREELYRRIRERAEQMIRGGAVGEVRGYLQRVRRHGGAPAPAIATAMGFREIQALVDGEIDENEAIERTAAAHRRYVRAQLTWLRRMEDVVIVDPSARPLEELADDIVARARAGCGQDREDGPVR